MKRFISNVLATVVGGGLLVFLCMPMVVMAIVGTDDVGDTYDLPNEYVLVLDSGVAVSEQGTMPDFMAALQGQDQKTTALRRVIEAIEFAADDDEVLAILIDNQLQVGGHSQQSRIRQALVQFKESGKKIIAYADGLDMRSYHLASVADEIYMPPMADFYFLGLSAELTSYAQALEKIGIEFQVTKVGKYKSAVEPFILNEASAENKEQIRTLLDDVQRVYLSEIASAGRHSVNELQSIMDEVAVMDATAAVAQNLITETMYRDELIDYLTKEYGEDSEQSTFIQAGSNSYFNAFDFTDDHDPNLAVVYADGEIIDGWSSADIGGDSLSEELRSVRGEEDIQAVVLRVNSPGGSAFASEQILREVELLRAAGKTVVVSMGDVAASGGYWISSRADAIVAEPNTITGSIGVFGMFPNYQKLREKIGVNVQSIKTGSYSDALTLSRSKTEAELALIQKSVDKVYDDFLDRVSSGRKLDRDAVHEIAQGRVWSGSRAHELGLVDSLGGLDDA
ncbi:MAG: signal peptide peptidase SppA, partial [Planctomycetota bacterium]|nr:signal peptide peptidase SppA [Planctomycetota bacterium]